MSVQAYEIREYGTGLRERLYRRSYAEAEQRRRRERNARWGASPRRTAPWPPPRRS